MRGVDQNVAVPALPPRPFVSRYAGSRMRDVPLSRVRTLRAMLVLARSPAR